MQPTKRPRSEDAWTVGSESPETLKAIADSVDRHDEQLWKIGQLVSISLQSPHTPDLMHSADQLHRYRIHVDPQ